MERPTADRDPWPWIGVASAIAFIVLATIATRSGGLAFDVPLANAIRSLPVPVRAWQLITALGGGLLLAVGVTLVLTCLLSGRLRLALIVALVLIGATLFTHVVKEFVERPGRPGRTSCRHPATAFHRATP